MDKAKKLPKWLVIAVIAFIALTYTEPLFAVLDYIGDLILPVGIGIVLAFILSVPVNGFERRLERFLSSRKRTYGKQTAHRIGLLLTLLCVVLILALFFTWIIPEVINAVKSIATLIELHWPEWMSKLESYDIDTEGIKAWVASVDFDNMLRDITANVGTLLGSIANATTSTVSALSTFVIGIVVAVYMLVDQQALMTQSKRLLYAYVKAPVADKICYIADLIRHAYAHFLTGQCVEAVILGVLIFVCFSLFRLPYAGLVGVVTAVCALIPYIGAVVSCALSVILTLMVSPTQAVLCLIVYLVVQFVETQFIYPHVVGSSVGLSPLWTVIAVLIGGKLFGLLGMIFFIPLVSVLQTLLREDIDRRLTEKACKTKGEVPYEVGDDTVHP